MTLASGTDLALLSPFDLHPQASNSMTLNTLNATVNRWALEVTATQAGSTTDILAVLCGILPSTYGGEAIDVTIYHSNSANSGKCLFSAELERNQAGSDMSADNFATLTEPATGTTVPGTASQMQLVTIASVTLPSGLTASDAIRLRIKRRLSNTTEDTNTGQTLIYGVRVSVH